MRIRILVAEDLPIARAGIVGVLQHDPLMTVIGEARDQNETIEMCEVLHPDLVVLGAYLAHTSGSTIAGFLDHWPALDAPRILMLSLDLDPLRVRAARQAGGSGYLPASITPQELLGAVRQVMRGEQVLPEPVTASKRPSYRALSAQELVVLKAIAAGCSTKEIAHRLSCSPRTVDTYVQRIFDKLGARSRAQAVSIAGQVGLL